MRDKPCLRCGKARGDHPSGQPYCLHYVQPAPVWLRTLNRALSPLRRG